VGRSVAVVGLLLSLLTLIFSAGSRQVAAQDTNRAAIVVRFDNERSESRCVAFEEQEISGYELLQRSGLALEVKSGGQGGLVCAIEGTGCGLNDCLCQCKGEPCVYWSYWRRADNEWTYSSIGATVRRLSHGDVDGWSWGPGSVTSAIEPAAVTFDQVCGSDAPLYDGSATSEAPDESLEQSNAWLPYVSFGLIVAILGGGALVAGRRRRQV
jgi:hypothetical protein